MSESSEVVGGGTSASAAVAPDALAVSVPVEEGGGGTSLEDTPLGCSPQPKECGTYGSNNMNELTSREIN